jgi:hypothetical protein
VAWAERSLSASPSSRATKRGRGLAGVAKADAGLHCSQTRRESNDCPRRPPCHASASINGGMGRDRLHLFFPCGHATKRGHGLADVAKVNVGQ